MIRLRGHHLLCLLGYRGMGYSDEFCINMTAIYERLRVQPETEIVMIEGPDDICGHYPKDQHAHCEGASVYTRDARVLDKLGMELGKPVPWSQVTAKVADHVEPGDIQVICASCPWEPYGVCKEGVDIIRRGESLPPAPSRSGGPAAAAER
ncbi:DUF1284 domain-containing protein [Paenibacillus puerhi]|uniref:DUF1284 domain-containing protein n=1 Tax=Paenibacillus puerhi TaxID=2692622 RepID=UPI001358AC9C|nr:DUF1284 domain-containing protein [Paenibacillus puerhi]